MNKTSWQQHEFKLRCEKRLEYKKKIKELNTQKVKKYEHHRGLLEFYTKKIQKIEKLM
jgi:hypothetical protein